LHAAALREAAEMVPLDVGLTTIAKSGVPAEVLLDATTEGDYDLVVVGGDRHGRLHDAVFGSISATLMSKARRPVLVVR
jgi:nucleotide-binding universal stress UspA family protein